MAIKALQLDTTRTHVSIFDDAKGTEDETKWLLGTLDSRTSGRIKDSATRFIVDPNSPDEEVSTSVSQSDVNYQRVQYGLKGFENFKDAKGNDVAFKTRTKRHGTQSYEIVDDSVMAIIPDAILAELAFEISKDNELTKEAAKNSGTP
jgi:hypothetical protein